MVPCYFIYSNFFLDRYHKIGLVVLFLHDIADVFLELTKIMKCFQNRTTTSRSAYHVITSLGFIFFASSW